MSFASPESDDFQNVASLNLAWLRLLCRDPAARRTRNPSAAPRLARLGSLSRAEAARLSGTPFLLFSFRERDDELWTRLLADSSHRGLFQERTASEAGLLRDAALGFIWRLARENPYVLRLVCGATMYWCERVAELTIYELLTAAACAGELPVLRFAGHPTLWEKLLANGISPHAELRSAAQLSALQTILTEPAAERRENLPVAASRSAAPGLRVAEGKGRHSDS